MAFDFDMYERLFAKVKVDPCALLGIDRENMNSAEIKKNYRARIRNAHPDKGATSDSECKLLNAAYVYLKELAALKETPPEKTSGAQCDSVFADRRPNRELRPPVFVVGSQQSPVITKWTPPEALPPCTNMDYARVRQSGGILMVTDSSDGSRLGVRLRDIRAMSPEGVGVETISDSYLTRDEIMARQSERAQLVVQAPSMNFKDACGAMDQRKALLATRESIENRRFIQENAARFDEDKRNMILSAMAMPSRRLLV
jgi:hypothetical protein